MILREGDARFFQRIDFEPGIDVAGKGEERRALRQVGEVAKAVGIELGELGRDVHQLRQPFLAQSRGRTGKALRFIRKLRRGRFEWRQGALEIERLGGGEQRDHAMAVTARRRPRQTDRRGAASGAHPLCRLTSSSE